MSGSDLKQRLAAILAADAAGYSRLMARDDRATVSALDAARSVFRTKIESNQGRVIDMAGDSVLAVFETAGGAVEAALGVQRMLHESFGAVPEERRMRFRIGVHLGDVIEKGDGTVYGDGVNIAARLEGLAEPGGITVSDSVRIAVKGKVAASFEDQGEQKVKNIPDPVRAHRVRPEGSATTASAAGEADLPLPDKPSIAVLPFNNMSGDAEQEYFADGITEDIITELSRISGMLVIARNSTFVYKKQAVDIKEVARRLGVRHVLEGSVRKAGKRVRITAQLIDATTGGHCWAERFDRDLEDIFAVQDEVTQHIVSELKVKLTASERTGRAPRGKVNPEAYDYVVRARQCFLRFTAESMNEARSLLERALQIDAGFPIAYAQLAMVHAAEYVNGYNQAGPAHLEQGKALARKALELDPEEAWAHQALAMNNLWQKDYEGAESAARSSTKLGPNFAGGFVSLGQVLDFTGRHEAAIEAFEHALRLDPGLDLILHLIGRAQLGMGRYAEAEHSFKRRLIRNPRSDMTRAYLASLYGATGRVEEARRMWAELLEINPKFSVERLRRVLPYTNPAWFESFAGGLRQAGLVPGTA
ncbi:MAG: adenylate/guanylate cyclase domain-containing protein [Betaproteobacteria bacterium]|nr:adenylate/guanylate cyclase domain-containing protein [Betaproteobacteria bacterium]